jgi:hypothetical protein
VTKNWEYKNDIVKRGVKRVFERAVDERRNELLMYKGRIAKMRR